MLNNVFKAFADRAEGQCLNLAQSWFAYEGLCNVTRSQMPHFHLEPPYLKHVALGYGPASSPPLDNNHFVFDYNMWKSFRREPIVARIPRFSFHGI